MVWGSVWGGAADDAPECSLPALAKLHRGMKGMWRCLAPVLGGPAAGGLILIGLPALAKLHRGIHAVRRMAERCTAATRLSSVRT